MPEPVTPDQLERLDWNSYLAELDLSNPALAMYLRSVLGDLPSSVPPAGEYTTGIDYETLYPALANQYVSSVIRSYETMLGPAPELYEAAVANGYMTAEAAAALQAEGFSRTGTLQQEFASRGGLRTLAGPYQAARTELLAEAQAKMGEAAQKAASDAYTLAQQATQTRVQALAESGRLGLGLVNAGVQRRNAQTAAGAGGGGGEPFDFPTRAAAEQPSMWERILPGLVQALGAAGIGYLTRPRAAEPLSGEEKARRDDEYDETRRDLAFNRRFGGEIGAIEDAVEYGAEPSTPPAPPVQQFQGPAFNTAANPYADFGSGGGGTYTSPAWQPQAWEAPMPSYGGGGWSGYDVPDYSYSFNDFSYAPSDYGYDFADYSYNANDFDYSYLSSPSYDYSYSAPSWSDYGDYSGGYWV